VTTARAFVEIDPARSPRQFVLSDPVHVAVTVDGFLRGILTRRDLKFVEDESTPVEQVMTTSGLVTAPPGTTLEQAEHILNKQKVEKLILVDGDFCLAGLITILGGVGHHVNTARAEGPLRGVTDPAAAGRCDGPPPTPADAQSRAGHPGIPAWQPRQHPGFSSRSCG
jgi:hypothetical protein